ncbi:MAG: hypothetical protein ABL866_11160 [Devosia sp.]
MDETDQRLERQFDRIGRQVPQASGFLAWVREPRARLIRIPLGILLVLGGIFSILPVLGLWMLPLGLLMLAIDIPPLRRPVANTVVRGQRWFSNLRRKWRDRGKS